jgi:hypothetical protein
MHIDDARHLGLPGDRRVRAGGHRHQAPGHRARGVPERVRRRRVAGTGTRTLLERLGASLAS